MRRSAFDIVFGLLLAIASAAVVLHGAAVARGSVSADIIRTFTAVAAFAIPLSLLVIWLAEIRRVRGLAFWVTAGGLLAGLAYASLPYIADSNVQPLMALLASGVAGGLIYWSVAGRRAGAFAAAIDRENRAAAVNDATARRRCWVCSVAMVLTGLVPLALIGWTVADPSHAVWPEQLRKRAEQQGNGRLAAAGLPWANLKIENHVGRIEGTAPTPLARLEGFSKVEAALSDMAGLPGIVAYLQNDIKVAATAEQPLVIADHRVLPASQVTTETRARRMRLGRGVRDARLRRVAKAQAERKLADQRAAAIARAAQDAAEAKRKAEAVAAEAAAKAKALEESRLAEAAKRKAEDERRLALEAAREKDAVAAARKAEAEKSETASNANAAKVPADASPPTNCDAEFAQLFKSAAVQFERNNSVLDAKLAAFFDNAASLAQRCVDYTIDVAGHADRTGSKAANLATSLARATSVRDALQARGVPLSRLRATGYGDSRPLDPSRNRAAFARNRRVELSATRSAAPSPPPQDIAGLSQAAKPLKAGACHVQLSRVSAATPIRFSVKGVRVQPSAARALGKLAHVMRRCPNHALTINGHADRRGSIEDNRELSERRANAVRDLLIKRGVDGDRLTAIGHGALMPLATNETRAGYAQNRRVDFSISAASPTSK